MFKTDKQAFCNEVEGSTHTCIKCISDTKLLPIRKFLALSFLLQYNQVSCQATIILLEKQECHLEEITCRWWFKFSCSLQVCLYVKTVFLSCLPGTVIHDMPIFPLNFKQGFPFSQQFPENNVFCSGASSLTFLSSIIPPSFLPRLPRFFPSQLSLIMQFKANLD